MSLAFGFVLSGHTIASLRGVVKSKGILRLRSADQPGGGHASQVGVSKSQEAYMCTGDTACVC